MRSVTFTAPDKIDLLFNIFAFERSPLRIFVARLVCKLWKQRVDGTNANSEDWRILLEMSVPHFRTLPRFTTADWKSVVMLQSRLLLVPQDGTIITFESLEIILAELLRVATMCACELGTSFKNVLSLRLRTKDKIHAIIYRVCTQKPPNNLSEQACNWWARSIPELRASIEARVVDAPVVNRQAACDSFDSFVKKMGQAMDYLNRFYVKRMSMPTLQEVALPEQDALRQALGVPLATS